MQTQTRRYLLPFPLVSLDMLSNALLNARCVFAVSLDSRHAVSSLRPCLRAGRLHAGDLFKDYGCFMLKDTAEMTCDGGSIHERLGGSLCWSKHCLYVCRLCCVVLSPPPVELVVWGSTASSGSARAVWYNVAMNLENAKRIMQPSEQSPSLTRYYSCTSCNNDVYLQTEIAVLLIRIKKQAA